MKLPRDISSSKLIMLLKIYGYSVVRQNGSHIRLTTFQNGQHHITIPNHHSINLGTLSSIDRRCGHTFQNIQTRNSSFNF